MRIILKNILLITLICYGECEFTSNETISEEVRQPRVSGRIVKLYSGPRPEPFLCPAEGFQADPTNCAVFYRCVGTANGKFTVFRFQCGPGTIYDPETEICNYPSSTKRSKCGGRKPGIGQDNEVEGNQSVLPVYTFKPNYEQKVTTAPWATSKPQQQSNSILSTSNPLTSNGANRKPSQSGDPCITSGFMGDSENCRKFFRCVGDQRGGFIRYEFMCSENTVWDDDAQSCNHPWAVQKRSCGRQSSGDANNSEQSTDHILLPSNIIQQQTQISYGNKVSQIQTQISNGSAIQNQTQINYGDRNNKESSEALQNQTQISFGSAISQAQTQINHENKGIQSQLQVDHSQQSSQAQTVQYDEQDSSNSEVAVTNEESTPNKENSQNECTESGFMGDKEDCKKFYRCVDNGRGGFTKYEFSCGEGTVWDSSIEACNHAWAVKECEGKRPTETESQSGSQSTTQNSQVTSEETHTTEPEKDNNCTQNQQPSTSTTTESESTSTTAKNPSEQGDKCTSSGFKGDSNDCKKFYRCVDNGNGGYTRYEFSCGEGTVWDQSIESCNHAWAVKDCNGTDSDSSEQLTEASTSTSTQASEQEPTSSTTTEKSETTSNTPSPTETTQQSEDVCKSEGFFGDSKDCKKFYRCVDNGKRGYIKYDFTCGEGTVWDPEINTCNYESPNTKCSKDQHTETSTTENIEIAATVNDEIITESPSDSHTSTQKQEAESPKNPPSSKECTREGFYGDADDCKKFYRCVDNGKGGYTKHEFTCGEGTVWDQEIQTCNYESNTNCSKSSQSSSSETQTESSETPSSSSTPKTEKTTQSSGISSSSDVCTSDGYFANSKDCKKFYRCVDNGKGGYTKYDFSCGEGTVWVQEIQTCDHDDGDQKCTRENSDYPGSSTTTEKNEKEPTDSSSIPATTPPEKQDDETSDNSSKPSSDNTCNSEGFYANQQDCKRFYRCVDNGKGGYTKYDFECGEGTAWDNDLQTCNHENEVGSCSRENAESTSKPVMQDEGTSQSTESTSSTTSSSSSSSSQSSDSENKDKCSQEGYYGNTEDCKKFYRCVDNGKGGFTKYDFDCGEGTIWDQDLTTCNHPQDVANPSCKPGSSSSGGNSNQGETSSSSSSTTESSTQKTSTTTESSQESSNCSQDSSSKKPSNSNVNCTKAGYYPNPDDCKKFYRCVDWDGDGTKFSVFHFECGEGTIWDPALDTCNHEDSVYPPRDCSKSQSENTNQQATSSTDGTTTESEDTTTTEQTTQAQEQTTEHSETTQQSSTTSEKTTTTTTQKSTTSQQTTQQSTTEKSTTEQTSESSTTQQTTSSEQITSQQTTEQTTSELTTSQQTTMEQTTPQQTTMEQTTSQPTTMEQTTPQQTTMEQTTTQQTEQTTSQQTTMEITTQESTDKETTTQSSTDSTTDKNDEHTTEQTTEGTTQESHTDQSTTSEMTTEGSSTSSTEESSTTESSSSSEKECPETDDDQHLFVCPSSFKRHPKYCNLFYQCDEDDDSHDVKIAVFHCPNDTIYDESQTKCVEESKADKKCNGQMAQRRRFKQLDTTRKEPIIVSKKSMKCATIGYFPVENEECSAGFLKCQSTKLGKLNGLIHRCPESHVYWSISKRCEPESKMRFCKRSSTDWNGRWEIPVERRNIAP